MFLTDNQLDEFLDNYLEAALWAECEDEEPLDASYSIGAFTQESRALARRDIEKFFSKLSEQAREEILRERPGEQYSGIALAGHDFWLTRRGHGAGFWDGDWVNGEEMTRVCEGMRDPNIESDGTEVYLS